MSIILDIDYKCGNGHTLLFGHLLLGKRLKFDSGSPTVCHCGGVYIYADIKNSVEYFTKRHNLLYTKSV